MPRGRRNTPTVLKLLRNNPGKRAINHDEVKPEVSADIPKCPKELKGEARKEWDRLAPQLHALRLLTDIDLGTFTILCEAWGSLREYEKLCRKVGAEAALKLRYRSAADEARRTYTKVAATFGLNPSERGRIKLPTLPKNAGAPTARDRFFGAARRGVR